MKTGHWVIGSLGWRVGPKTERRTPNAASRLLTILVCLLLTTFAFAIEGTAGPYRVGVVTDPAVVPVGRATLRITVRGGDGKPIRGAQVRAIAQMPGMFMGEREQTATETDAGVYTAPAVFSMAGSYEVVVNVSGSEGTGKATLPMQTGESSTGEKEFNPTPWIIGLGVASLAAFVLVRMRRTGQRANLRTIFSGQVLTALLVLGGAIAVAVYAVNNLRRPGSMTPIEAQVMDMSAPAPEGVTAVTLATVKVQPVAATVTYAGQAVGFVEQDVVPRVGGTILLMTAYVGDRVRKGQVLARLDTSQLDPEVAMRSAGVNTSQQEVSVAASEYRMALNMVSEARAEVTMARSEVAEAQAMLQAAEQGRATAQAELSSAQAEVQAMGADLQARQAENEFMQAELKRMQQLLDAGAVSRAEFQKSQSEAAKSAAEVRAAREAVRKAESIVASARAMQRRVEAEIAAARRKVQNAEAGVRAKQAAVTRAQAGAEAAGQKIGKARAMVQESLAGLRGATTQRGYAELKAETDGVVTQRLISPGQTVSPGQAVLRVAQISPLRVQANVPEADLGRVQVGNLVRVIVPSGGSLSAKVASVAPSVEPNARTGVVEALLPNTSGQLKPGQFVRMEISVGARGDALGVPVAALRQEVGGETFVWVAAPLSGQAGRFTVTRQSVETGDRSGDLATVRTGLQAGQQVVVQGGVDLRGGQTVVSADAPTAVADNITVKVTEAGYDPPTLQLAAGKPHRLTFIRTAEQGCGDEIVFPALGIRKKLPLNQPVVIDLPARQEGDLSFTCGMDMLRGKAVVR